MAERNPAAVPTQLNDWQGDGRWMSIHKRFVAEAKTAEPEVVFVGDSIIAQLEQTDIWKKWFVPFHCLNFGIGGDQTQHILWRIQNGELNIIKPKVVVLMAGTNNHEHTAEQVAGGIKALVEAVREKQPQALILVLAILPRGQFRNRLRDKIVEVNKLVAEFVKNTPNCDMLDISCDLVREGDETISHRDMYDYLHLTAEGYKKAFELVYEYLLGVFSSSDEAAEAVEK